MVISTLSGWFALGLSGSEGPSHDIIDPVAVKCTQLVALFVFSQQSPPTTMSQAATEEPPSARPQVEGEEPKEKSPTPPPAPSDEPQHDYPTGLKFATIFISLLLAVFCVALDNTVRPRQRPMSPRADLTMPPRSSLQQSPGSRMPSRPSMMSDGTGQRIF